MYKDKIYPCIVHAQASVPQYLHELKDANVSTILKVKLLFM